MPRHQPVSDDRWSDPALYRPGPLQAPWRSRYRATARRLTLAVGLYLLALAAGITVLVEHL